MELIKQVCPCCGAVLRKKRFSNRYICKYCDNEFEIKDDIESQRDNISQKIVAIDKNEDNVKKNMIIKLSMIVGISITLLVIAIFCSTAKDGKSGTNSKYTVSHQSSFGYTSQTGNSNNVEQIEFYDFPRSGRGKQIASLIFEKPFEEVTKDDLDRVKYLAFDSDYDINSNSDKEMIYYSFENYKDYDNWSDFEDTIQSVKYTGDNREEDFDDTDYACFKNLTCLECNYINEAVFEGLKNMTSYHISRIDVAKMEKYCDLSKVDDLKLDYDEDDKESFEEILPKMTNLRKLSIDCYELKAMPDSIKTMTWITSLELNNAKQLKDFSYIKKFTNLKELVISSGEQFKDLSIIKELPKLESLTLVGTNVKDYEVLRDNQNIRKLVLDYNDEVDDISPVSTLTNLEEFKTTIYTIDMSSLSSLSNMKRLELSTNGTVPLKFISGMTNLEELTLHGCNLADDISSLYNLEKLRKIVITSPDEYVDFNDLMNIQNLEEIYISGAEYDSVWLNNLLQMKTLKTLSVKNVDLHMDFNLDLSESGIETLILDGITLYQEDAWDKAEIDNVTGMLKTAPKLIRLELSGVGVDDLNDISEISTLEKLDVSDNYIDDYGQVNLLNNLKWIKIGGNVNSDISNIKGICIYTDDGHICRQ